MKYKKEFETTTNRTVYTKMYRKRLEDIDGVCYYCHPHRGCNSGWNRHRPHRSWKEYRRFQWK